MSPLLKVQVMLSPGMDPKFIGEKRDCLLGHVCTLTTNGSVPILLAPSHAHNSQHDPQRDDLTPKRVHEFHKTTSKLVSRTALLSAGLRAKSRSSAENDRIVVRGVLQGNGEKVENSCICLL